MTPNPQDSAVALEVERAAFEAWFRKEYHDRLCRNMPDKSYNDPTAHATWGSWQACASQSDGTSGVLTDAEVEDLYVLACRDWNDATGEFPSVGVFLAKRIFAALAAKTKSQGENHVG